MLRLSSSDLDAHGKIGRRKILGHARKQNAQLAEAFQFFAANVAGFQVLPDLSTLFNAPPAGNSIIEIARQIGSYCVALHWTPLPVELARGTSIVVTAKRSTHSEESMTRRAAENASPKGDGCASETLPCEAVCARAP